MRRITGNRTANRDAEGRCAKVPYATRAKARKRLRQQNRTAGPRAVYYCRECAAWHLTSQRTDQ